MGTLFSLDFQTFATSGSVVTDDGSGLKTFLRKMDQPCLQHAVLKSAMKAPSLNDCASATIVVTHLLVDIGIQVPNE